MANPQKENGHIDIANEIAEALARTNLSAYESRYLWVLWRKTYGWHKKEDGITNSQFSDATGIKRPHIWRTEQALINRNIVTSTGNKLQFNKDYTQWRELPKQVTVTYIGTRVTSTGNKQLPNQVHTKETTKEIIQKKDSDVPSQDIIEIIDSFKEVNPTYGKWYRNTTQRSAIERMLTIHGKNQLKNVVSFLPQSNKVPFIPCATTPLQLEDKWAAIRDGWMRKKAELQINKPKIAFT